MSNGHVQPGEVISSTLINSILDRLQALEAGSGGGGPTPEGIVLSGFSPPLEQEVGLVLAILGSHLPFPPDGSTVLIDGVAVPAELLRVSSSNQQRIELVVPEIGVVPAGGRSVFVEVRGGGDSAQLAYRILPSSGVVTPVVNTIHIEGGPLSANLIPVGQTAVVLGSGFSQNPDDLTLTFTPLGITPTPEPYPRAGEELTLSPVSAQELRVTVPAMSEIGTSQTRIRLTVSVQGAPDPGVGEFFTIPA